MIYLLDRLLGKDTLRKQLVVAKQSTDYYRQELESLKWATLPVDIPTTSVWNLTLDAIQAENQNLRAQVNKQTALANAWKIIATQNGVLK